MQKALLMPDGPVEIVESKGVKVRIYFTPAFGKEGYTVVYYANGKRIRERVGSLEEARKHSKAKIKDLTEGSAHVSNFTPRQTAVIAEVTDKLRGIGVALSQVASEYVEAHKLLDGQASIVDASRFYAAYLEDQKKKGELARISVSALIGKFEADIAVREKSRRYKLDIQTRLSKLSKAFNCNIDSITTSQLDDWLNSFKGISGRTRNNFRGSAITLFSFARQKGYLPRGQKTEAEFTARFDGSGGEIEIYTPGQLSVLLNNIEERLIPFIALGGFAGLRSAEITRLDWKEVRFDQGTIEIKKAKSKTASRRLIPILPALKVWLKPLAKKSGLVLGGVDDFYLSVIFRRALARMVDDKGKPLVESVRNGLRHSFVSYRLAVVKSAPQVALEAGNSPKMIFEHYRELVTSAQAKAWFGVLPKMKSKARIA